MNLLFSWNWCEKLSDIFALVKTLLNIIRIVVPIGLVALTTVDITKKVINPDEKDGQQKIMIRAIAALIVFLVPTFVRLTFRLIDWGNGNDGSYDNPESGLSQCWK